MRREAADCGRRDKPALILLTVNMKLKDFFFLLKRITLFKAIGSNGDPGSGRPPLGPEGQVVPRQAEQMRAVKEKKRACFNLASK